MTVSGNNGTITVVGIGADGMAGLGRAARDELISATVIFGGPRQLDLLGADVTAQRRAWPSPMLAALPTLVVLVLCQRVIMRGIVVPVEK